MCMYTNTLYILHIYIYIYMCVCVCITYVFMFPTAAVINYNKQS